GGVPPGGGGRGGAGRARGGGWGGSPPPYSRGLIVGIRENPLRDLDGIGVPEIIGFQGPGVSARSPRLCRLGRFGEHDLKPAVSKGQFIVGLRRRVLRSGELR